VVRALRVVVERVVRALRVVVERVVRALRVVVEHAVRALLVAVARAAEAVERALQVSLVPAPLTTLSKLMAPPSITLSCLPVQLDLVMAFSVDASRRCMTAGLLWDFPQQEECLEAMLLSESPAPTRSSSMTWRVMVHNLPCPKTNRL